MRYALPVLLLLSGCLLQNMGAEEHLRDAINQLNEGMRWSREDMAIPRVAPSYRHDFAKNHSKWGHDVHIADSELLGVEIADGRQSAVSTVAIRWYAYDTMTIHQAVIRQRWKRANGGYYLVKERVVSGDPRILAPPPAPDKEPG